MHNYDGGIAEMTQEAHDDLVASGCDPHCHACGVVIRVGDRWAFKRFVKAGDLVTGDGLVVGDIRGTCCEACVIGGNDLSAAERARLEAALTSLESRMAAAAKTVQKKEAVEALQPPPPPRRGGCFVLEDGTRF